MDFRVTGELSVRRVWTCRKCGKRSLGASMRITLARTDDPTAAVVQHLTHAPLTDFPALTDFPVGWAGYGSAGAECGDHER